MQKDPTEQQFPSLRVLALHLTDDFPRVSHYSNKNLLTDRKLKPFFPGYASCSGAPRAREARVGGDPLLSKSTPLL